MRLQAEGERGVVSKVTSKLQVTIPKAIADRFGIEPGGKIVWEVAGGSLRVAGTGRARQLDAPERERLFRESIRASRVQEGAAINAAAAAKRGWTWDDLYEDRGGCSR